MEQLAELLKQAYEAKITGFEEKRKQLGMSPSQFYAVPRNPPSASKLPIFDKAYTKNAMARFNQVQGLSADEKKTAFNKILRAAHKFGIETTNFLKLKP